MNNNRTIYFVNGNSPDIEDIMDGTLNAPRNEEFIVLTNEKISDKNRRFVTELCTKSDMIKERIIKYSSNWFNHFVKSSFLNIIKNPSDRVVVMPQIPVSGDRFVQAVGKGIVAIRNRYMDESDQKIVANYKSISEDNLPNVRPGGIVHILVDYENVNNDGLIGAQYLDRDDRVTVFYSDTNTTIQKGFFNDLVQRAGSFDMVKLKQVRRNGLDFYIATRIGQLLETNPYEKILIISKDQGYLAVTDYCEKYAGMRDGIQLAETIEAGILVIDGDTERRRKILDSRSVVSLESEYALYNERNALYRQIAGLLANTPYMDDIDQIFGIMEYSPTLKEKYAATLHAFGIKRGQEIYRIMKRLGAA